MVPPQLLHLTSSPPPELKSLPPKATSSLRLCSVASVVVVRREALDVALGLSEQDVALGMSEQVGDNAADAAPLKTGRVVAISSVGLLSSWPVSVRPNDTGLLTVQSVVPSVGHGPCTFLPIGAGVSERVCDDAANVTAL